MPTIPVNKAALYTTLGRTYSTKEFDELCFDFGLELDEETEEELKIEVPANRYDMLCLEGIALNLCVFLGQRELPIVRLKAPPQGNLQVLEVKPETTKIRPFVSCAVLRGVRFNKARYDSFIALQDKLHQNLARQRTLVSIGTHDLDKIQGPFSYEALSPDEIKFVPLNQQKEMNAIEIMSFYEKDKHLGRYLHIIRDSPIYPVIYDANRTVLSLPPIINGNHSKITLDTTNVFIEITALDKTKVEIVNRILVSTFSEYCSEPFTVEPVQVTSSHNHEKRQTPDLKSLHMPAEISYINSCLDLDLSAEKVCALLKRMGHRASQRTPSAMLSKAAADLELEAELDILKKEWVDRDITATGYEKQRAKLLSKYLGAGWDLIDVQVPCTRADVLHQVDIMEDVAVAYGINNLPRVWPKGAEEKISAPLPINELADIVRNEACKHWSEVLPFILCSHDENFAWLNRKDDGKTAVVMQNPKTAEFQIVRTSLLPGLLKCIRENKHHSVPIQVFEVSDVAFKDQGQERKSRNERHFAAAWYGKVDGFEMVHGLLDRVMLMLKCKWLAGQAAKADGKTDGGIFLSGKRSMVGLKVEGYWYQAVDRESILSLLRFHSILTLGTDNFGKCRFSLCTRQGSHGQCQRRGQAL